MSIIQHLSRIFDDHHIHTDPDSLSHYGCDRSKVHLPAPCAVVFPENTQEVQKLVQAANAQAFSLVPSGGRTGLSGGASAANGEVVVSFERMNQIINVDPVDRSITCQAGVITQTLQDTAKAHDLFYPVDFASSGSSHIGGNIATNAGGIKVLGYGLTRNWISGLCVVTGDGNILNLNQGLCKNATGYDLRHLFIGSEGTLGLITQATVQLTDMPKNLTVMLLAVNDIASLMRVFSIMRNALPLCAFECFCQHALEIVCTHLNLSKPLSCTAKYYVLLEFENNNDLMTDTALEAFNQCIEAGLCIDGVMSQNARQAENLWQLREQISESIHQFTPYKNDLSVRVSDIPKFLIDLDQLISQSHAHFSVLWYGHIGDGNLHLNILKPDNMLADDFFAQCGKLNKQVFSLVKKYQGSISAEHGVGLIKRDYLHYSRSDTEIAYMRAMKQVFDPNCVLNPGKIFV